MVPSGSNDEPVEENFHPPRYILLDRHARPDKGIPDKCAVGYSAGRSHRLRSDASRLYRTRVVCDREKESFLDPAAQAE